MGISEGSSEDTSAAEPAHEGIAHLQAAAREMIAAARSFLDVVDDVVNDDDRLGQAVGGMTDFVRQATDAVSRAGRRSTDTDRPADRVRHIVVE